MFHGNPVTNFYSYVTDEPVTMRLHYNNIWDHMRQYKIYILGMQPTSKVKWNSNRMDNSKHDTLSALWLRQNIKYKKNITQALRTITLQQQQQQQQHYQNVLLVKCVNNNCKKQYYDCIKIPNTRKKKNQLWREKTEANKNINKSYILYKLSLYHQTFGPIQDIKYKL